MLSTFILDFTPSFTVLWFSPYLYRLLFSPSVPCKPRPLEFSSVDKSAPLFSVRTLIPETHTTARAATATHIHIWWCSVEYSTRSICVQDTPGDKIAFSSRPALGELLFVLIDSVVIWVKCLSSVRLIGNHKTCC